MSTIRKEGGGQVWVHDGPDVRDNLLKLDLIQIKFLMESVSTSVQLLAKGAENNLWVWVQQGLGVAGTRADNKYNCDNKNNHGVWVYV